LWNIHYLNFLFSKFIKEQLSTFIKKNFQNLFKILVIFKSFILSNISEHFSIIEKFTKIFIERFQNSVDFSFFPIFKFNK
jgi:CRISPR/Cas system-associated protein Csx1